MVRSAAAAQSRIPPVALRDPPVTLRPTVWWVSRETIYRVKSSIQRVHKAEFSRAWAAMREIADWLTRLGLPEYAGAFAENGIDVSVLPHLTDQDLKDIGVLLGHRRKILAAVAELPGKAPSASKRFPPLVDASDRHTTEPPQPAPGVPLSTEAMGERRHVAVMSATWWTRQASRRNLTPRNGVT
jgi:SAM domain (Sterile alpha motif)